MTTSEYSYATVAEIEAYTGIDYSAVNATLFTDILIESRITIAERIINGYLGVSAAQTVTDGIKVTTILVTAKILAGSMAEMGYHTENRYTQELIDLSLPRILKMFLDSDQSIGVDMVPMSGADNDL